MGMIKQVAKWLVLLATAGFGSFALTGCIATSFVAMAVEQTPVAQGNCLTFGCASVEIAGYVYDKATEGDAAPCRKLNTVARALSVRCGYDVGSLDPRDVVASGLPTCPLIIATRDARLWPAIPELVAKGASTARCRESPLAALAATDACPDFAAASPQSLAALRAMAETDPRAVQHDVMRMLSCPNARRVALDTVLDDWAAAGRLSAKGGRLGFSPLAALHPSALESPLAHRLEADGHDVYAAFGGYGGRLPTGFDLALRTANLEALDWWITRMPQLADRVPSAQGVWLPLVRVVTPTYLVDPARQADVVAFLIARGANPKQALPFDPTRNVVSLARQLKSPVLGLLDAPGDFGRLTVVRATTDRVASVR